MTSQPPGESSWLLWAKKCWRIPREARLVSKQPRSMRAARPGRYGPSMTAESACQWALRRAGVPARMRSHVDLGPAH